MTDEELMQEALAEAEIARNNGDWAIGCIITLDGEVIARGRNKVFSTHNKLIHAEIDAITNMQENHFDTWGKNLTLYTTLEPCPMCFGAILLAGIRHIVAGTNFDNSGASAYMPYIPGFFQQPHFETHLTTGILAKECAEMWLSGHPAQNLLKRGFTPQKPIEAITNSDISIIISPVNIRKT
jgi:tRNA(adenine34) deaminase